jgi:hypothetical protein
MKQSIDSGRERRGIVQKTLLLLIAIGLVITGYFVFRSLSSKDVSQSAGGNDTSLRTHVAENPIGTVQRNTAPQEPEPVESEAKQQTSLDKGSDALTTADSLSHGAESSPRQPDVENGQPGGEFSLAGQALDEAGRPISEIEVIALLRGTDDMDANTMTDQGQHRIATDETGRFTFEGLADGLYEIRAVATEKYLGAATRARAGATSVKLVLVTGREVEISGQVSSADGWPLENVEISVTGYNIGPLAKTDVAGKYRLHLAVRGDWRYILTFRAEGYSTQKIGFSEQDWQPTGAIERDVTMVPVSTIPIEIFGNVKNSSGEPMSGETLHLRSAGPRHDYVAVTDPSGEFSFTDVEAGAEDYSLWLQPKGLYRAYVKRHLTLAVDDPNNFEIVLEPMSVGSLSGRMIDVDGNPVPNLTFVLRSKNAPGLELEVTGDQQGYYKVDEVPDGQLSLKTPPPSFPVFFVDGVQLPEGGDQRVDLILDHGKHSIEGRVVDSLGGAVGGADIRLSRSYQHNGLTYTSYHTAVSAVDGTFKLTQLGSSGYHEHRLHVRAPGFQSATVPFDVGESAAAEAPIEVQLMAFP